MLLLEPILRDWSSSSLAVLKPIYRFRYTKDLEPLPRKLLSVRDTDETEDLLICFDVQWSNHSLRTVAVAKY